MATNKKPPIYAFCKAGSPYQVPHLSDFDNVAAFVEVPIEYTEAGRPIAYIEPCKKYRIFTENRAAVETQFAAKVSVTVSASPVGSEGFTHDLAYVTRPVSYSPKDNYDFEFLGVNKSQTSDGKWEIEYAYTINGKLITEKAVFESLNIPTNTIERLVVIDATRVLQVNDNSVVENSVVTVKTINGKDISFFWGTNAEYELLTEAETQGLFALITDEAKIHQHNLRLQFADGAVVLFAYFTKTALPCEDYTALTTLLASARTQTDNEGRVSTGMLSATGVDANGNTIYGIEQYMAGESAELKLHINQNGANSITVGTPSVVADNVIEL